MAPRGKKLAMLAGGTVFVLLLTVVVLFRDEIRSWYLLWKQFESLGKNAQGYPEYRHRETGIVFVRVPGGEFWMGSSKEDLEKAYEIYASTPSPGIQKKSKERFIEGRIKGEQSHRVTLSPFLLAKFEVTQKQWKRVMGDLPPILKRLARPMIYASTGRPAPSRSLGDEYPIEMVSWSDAKEFCEKTGFRLPTEAQWEYSCRAGSEGLHADTGILDEMGWYLDNSGEKSHPVGSKKPNGFGLHDMHGNVAEWCQDEYSGSFYSTPEASKRDPVCKVGVGTQVKRGGSYGHSRLGLRSAARSHQGKSQGYYTGFRPVYPLH